jgi:mono/diheme cytochrome c family protein
MESDHTLILIKMKKYIASCVVFIGCLILIVSLFSAFSPANQEKPWPVPETAKNKKNPVASDAESISNGKTLYATHCKSCHGNKGLGDGSKAPQLKTDAGNFSKAEFQAQTDGALFYKTSEGREDMPSFKKKIPDADDIWSIVNYMRTLKK